MVKNDVIFSITSDEVSGKNNQGGNYNWLAWPVGLAGVGAVGYYFGKNRK